jgi:hypothetical protein
MKTSWCLLLVALLCVSVWAEVEIAKTTDDVKRFLEENQDNTAALFFIDSSAIDGSETGFWSGIVTSVTHVFSGEDTIANTPQRVAEIEKDISTDAALLQVDISNEDFREIQESYDVTTVPFLILFKKGIAVLKEVPTHETHDKILQVLNVNPIGIHDEVVPEEVVETPVSPVAVETVVPESEPVVVVEEPEVVVPEPEVVVLEEPTPIAIETPELVVVEEPEVVVIDEPEPFFIEEPVVIEEPEIIELEPMIIEPTPIVVERTTVVEVEPRRVSIPEPQVAENLKWRTESSDDRPDRVYAPTPEIVQPAPAQKELPNPDDRHKFVFHRCHDLSSHNDFECIYWREGPNYISELEDYEIPEDWWRNGYNPLQENYRSPAKPEEVSDEEFITRERDVYVVEPIQYAHREPIIYEAPNVRFAPEPVLRVAPEPVRAIHAPEPIHSIHAPYHNGRYMHNATAPTARRGVNLGGNHQFSAASKPIATSTPNTAIRPNATSSVSRAPVRPPTGRPSTPIATSTTRSAGTSSVSAPRPTHTSTTRSTGPASGPRLTAPTSVSGPRPTASSTTSAPRPNSTARSGPNTSAPRPASTTTSTTSPSAPRPSGPSNSAPSTASTTQIPPATRGPTTGTSH